MKLLEYEAKQLLAQAQIGIPRGQVIYTRTDTPQLDFPVVLKSQVPTGGRGKAGGVVIIEDDKQLEADIRKLFNLPIQGLLPTVLLAEEKLAIQKEYYLSLLVDRATASIRLVAHPNGGVEVEANDTDGFLNVEINHDVIPEVAERLQTLFAYPPDPLVSLLYNLFAAFTKNDALLLEINPLIITKTGQLVCGDCKMELDNASAFRHPDWQFEHEPLDRNYVVLNPNGTIATIANGAGLAMATVDAVVARGMTPANFLDIGGGATTENVYEALAKLQEFFHLEAIIVNIFAGITRCDQIAQAIIDAQARLPHLPPIFIRLAGTNFEEAVALLTAKNIPTLTTLEECLDKAAEVNK